MASSFSATMTSSFSSTMASSSSSSSKKITLRSSDGQIFDVDENAAMLSVTIKNLIEDIGDSKKIIPLPNVTSAILKKVIDYCNKHAAQGKPNPKPQGEDYELNQWYQKFLHVDQDTFFDLILAANYLNIKGLMDITCEHVAGMMRGKKPEEIRAIFNIKNDYTPKEEAQIRKELQWAFDD